MRGVADPVKLERVLKELYAKKEWLDTMIASLEVAVKSPHYQFIQRVDQAFGNGSTGVRPRVDIRWQQQTRLAELAAEIGRGRRARRGKTSAARSVDEG